MGATKDMWCDAVESVLEAYRVGNLEFPEAVACLTRMGLDNFEAETMLSEAVS